MGILKVLVVCTTLLHTSHTIMGVPRGHIPPPGAVVQGDVIRIVERTPTVYLVRQIYEHPNRPPVPQHFFPNPLPISEPYGTTGWVPVAPPLGQEQPSAVPVQRPVQLPQYRPSTLMYPLEKPQNWLNGRERAPPPSIPEPRPQEFMREAFNLRSAVSNISAVQATSAPVIESTTTELAKGQVDVTHLATSTEPTVTVDSATQLPASAYPTNNASESDSSLLSITEQTREDALLETAEGDATATQAVVPTEVRTVATPGGEKGRRNYALASGAVAGIVVGAISIVALLTGLATYIILRRPFVKLLNGNDKSSAENVAYIDDSFRGGYMNTHVELPKESSEEMTSLDNDSFLNSLEAVTIQNYWADSTATRNTNV
ncbi:uncharacterized protein LOC135393863 isoform X2 [Ornithodoros turicata]|uniref:uncharacterized protein LOC135393863 isoform X2 n=1 Tax=Ornithodoros turicata TaxID=34597 RepID=UPI003139FE31